MPRYSRWIGGTSAADTTSTGLTFLDLYGSRLDIELGTTDRSQLFTTALRKQAVNDAQAAFVRLTAATKVYASVDVISETAEYDLESLTNYLRLLGAPSIKIVKGALTRYIQGNESFPRREAEELDQENPGWRGASASTPICWYLREDAGATYLGLYPPPLPAAGETWNLLIPYLYSPVAMTADGSIPFTINGNPLQRLSMYHEGLVHYAAAQLESLRKNYDAYDRQMKLFAGWVATFYSHKTEDQAPQITLRRGYYGENVSCAQDPWRWP